jgi:hypothetical protein
MPPTHKKSTVGEKIARTAAAAGASVAVAFGASFFAFSNRRAKAHPTD